MSSSIKFQKKFQEPGNKISDLQLKNTAGENDQGIVLREEWSVSTWIKQLPTNIADISRRVAFICSLISCLLVCYWLFIGSEGTAGWVDNEQSTGQGEEHPPCYWSPIASVTTSLPHTLPHLLTHQANKGTVGGGCWICEYFRASLSPVAGHWLAFIAHTQVTQVFGSFVIGCTCLCR